MKVGMDLKTGFRRSLWSWKSTNDPSNDTSIIARAVMQVNGVLQLSIWNNQTQNWDGFVSVPADNCEIYGQCDAYGLSNSGNSPICGCLDKFEPKNSTDWARENWSSGCVRKTPLKCQKEVKFLKYSGIKFPDTRFSWYSRGMTRNACEGLCLRNCSCVAYANPDITGTNEGCLLWYDELIDLREFGASGQEIYIKLDSSECFSLNTYHWYQSRRSSRRTMPANTANSEMRREIDELREQVRQLGEKQDRALDEIRKLIANVAANTQSTVPAPTSPVEAFPAAAGHGGGYAGNSCREKFKRLRMSLPLAAVTLLSALCLILYIRQKKKDQNHRRFSEVRGRKISEMFCANKNKDGEDLPFFDFATIADATDSFSLNNKLGEGGFGPVYKMEIGLTAYLA